MRTLTYTQIGTHHGNHNEDAHVTAELSDRHQLIAVANGSAAGDKGYFTAALVAQLLEKIAGEANLKSFAEKSNPSTAELIKHCTRQLFTELEQLRTRVNLQPDDLRVTLTLGVVDEGQQTAELVVIGAGIISCDGETVEMAQYAQPDYLADHLNEEDFDAWWATHDKRVVCQNCLDLSIATPGALTFEAFSHDPYRPVTEDELLDFLLVERNDGLVEQLFRRKMLYIEDKFGLLPTDDVTIIRVFLLD